MTKLSPAAQAVFESFNSRFDWVEDGVPGPAIAAALHAAASQLMAVQWNGQMPVSATEQIGINWARDALHVLANELKALNFKKPSSLKEQALKAAHIELDPQGHNGSLIICALEALPDD